MLAMPMRRFLDFAYGNLIKGLDAQKLREVNNILFRDSALQTTLVPGVPIPAWVDLSDLPPGSIVRVEDGKQVPQPQEDPRVAEYLAKAPLPKPK